MTSHSPLAVFDLDDPSGHVVLRMEGFPDLRLGRRAALFSARVNVDTILEHFRGLVERERPGLETLKRALHYLDGELAQFAFDLVGRNADRLDEVRMRLIRRWPDWRHSDAVPIVEVRGHDDYFPFEVLPLLDSKPFAEFVNLDEVATGLRRFLGFSMAVRRVGPFPVRNDPLVAAPRLPVQLITYDMAGAKTEAATFGLRPDLMSVDGPWPAAGLDQDEVEQRLLDVLFDPAVALDGGRNTDGAAQIQHFACHCLTENRTDIGYTLLVGGPGEQKRTLTMLAILNGYRQRTQDRGVSAASRSLVVVNACGSAKVDQHTRRSFPEWFLNNRHRGFVGTEVDVPDSVAAVFAEEFYAALLQRIPLGEAVVQARRRLFLRWQNPLGLLYACYGDPNLIVESN
ncbi:CHAT domain-containing protein [Actinoplanes sp. HUAS TT8]|uniref:CHAT domain-containing protein n=1 Tax=Actinoplanes sp. HUAS TT8 TaxID=3447453 RepID=UPI003F51B584